MAFNRITEGLIKAIKSIAERNAREARKPSRNWEFESAGTMVHAKHCLPEDMRQEIRAILERAQLAQSSDEYKRILAELTAYPVSFVKVKRATRVDRSRYTGDLLRQIRAVGGGVKEQLRAAKRAGRAAPSVDDDSRVNWSRAVAAE